MSKYISINISDACMQDWNGMENRETGKYCGSCKKTVIDFTTMSDTQIAIYFKQNKSSVCGRFYDDQLNKQIALPKRELPWLKYFFTITLPAFSFLTKVACSKNSFKEKIIQKAGKIKSKTNTTFIEKIPLNKKDSFVNLEEVRVTTHLQTRAANVTMGATIAGINIFIKEDENAKPENDAVKIFPNPIVQNSKLNIFWKNAVSKNQLVEIFDGNGNLIQKETLLISTNTQQAFIFLKTLPAGFYIIKITDSKTNLQLSKVFVVQ